MAKRYVSKAMVPKFNKACEPFLTWLKTAEEESDGEEEENGNSDASVDHSKPTAVPQNGQKVEEQVAEEGSDDEDLDIDAI